MNNIPHMANILYICILHNILESLDAIPPFLSFFSLILNSFLSDKIRFSGSMADGRAEVEPL